VHLLSYESRGKLGGFADIAVVEFTDPKVRVIAVPAALPRFELETPEPGDQLNVSGFPESAENLKSQIDHARCLAGPPTELGWITSESAAAYGSEIRPGFSGAPVWSFNQRGVIGIVSEADRQRRTGVVIPNSILRHAVPLPVPPPDSASSTLVKAQTECALTRPGLLRYALDRLAPKLHLWITERAHLLPVPPERELLVEALTELAARFETDISKRVYVKGEARELPEISGPFRPIRQLIREVAGLSAGGDAADANISAASKRSRRIRDLLRNLRRSTKPVILLGEPGAGKTLTLQQLAIAFARREETRVYPSLCIFVRLGRWRPVADGEEPHEGSVRMLVREVCAEPLRPYLADLERERRLMIIFDGMDEMSRHRYIEHTAALNTYAGYHKGRVQTIFSCRIADFAPNFSHRRFVLLTFDRIHVRTYLRHQFLGRTIEIDGRKLTINELTNMIASEELPIRATNPYVLYLLCLYILNRRTLPKTRTELLSYYFEYAVAREESELKAVDLPHRWRELFDLWALVARAITEANRGSFIRRIELELLLGQTVGKVIRSGQIVGAIDESQDEDP
jgi:hypothetical protein